MIERADPHRHAERGDQRDDRDERLLSPREQVAEGDVEFEGHGRLQTTDYRLQGYRLQASGRRPMACDMPPGRVMSRDHEN